MLVCEGLADEPLQDLGGRTPLEAAKTPFMDSLAKRGQLGMASFVPHSLPLASEIAAMALLGLDPKKFYTGMAPLEAIAMHLEQKDGAIAFRADLVTVLDDILVDASPGPISQKESQALIEALNRKLADARVRFHACQSYKNILMIQDPEIVQALDRLECASPASLIGENISKHLPRGKSGAEAYLRIRTPNQ